VTDTCLPCNDLANRDQKSLFATFQSQSSISSIKLANELQCHSVNVCANCACLFFFTTSSCRMHQSTCCSKACVSTPDGRGHSWPPSAVGKVHREFALDHGTCHAFLYTCTQIFCRPSNSLCDHSMRAAENWKALIPFCAKSSAKSSGVSGWRLIRSRATLTFSRTTSLGKIPAKKWGDTEIAERGRSVLVMRARYRSAGLTLHQRGWTDAG